LAFAVAAHLEPEILVIDEVLAVGDAAFQRKCLHKMEKVTGEGRTILFVSHNTQAIRALCPRAVLLDGGRVIADGPIDRTLEAYKQSFVSLDDLKAEVEDSGQWSRAGNGEAHIFQVRLENDLGKPQVQYGMGEKLVIVVKAVFNAEIENPIFGVRIITDAGVVVADCRSSHYNINNGPIKGVVEYRICIKSVSLYPRKYVIEPWITDQTDLIVLDLVRNAAAFLVVSNQSFVSGLNVDANHGIVFIPTSWAVSTI
jgi:lipopolysaccharide transport system ATP-binding protein